VVLSEQWESFDSCRFSCKEARWNEEDSGL